MVPWPVACLTNNQIQWKLAVVQVNMLRLPNPDKIQLRNDPAENKSNSGVFRTLSIIYDETFQENS